MTESPRLPAWEPGVLDDARREVVEMVTGERGRMPTPYRVWLASPELARRLHPLGQFFARLTSLSKAEAEIAILAAAQHWGGQYVLAVHAREARVAGLAEEVIAALEQGHPTQPADSRQRAVALTMAALATAGTPSGEVFDAAVAALGHDGVAEVIALAGYFTAVTLAMKMYAVDPPSPGHGRDQRLDVG